MTIHAASRHLAVVLTLLVAPVLVAAVAFVSPASAAQVQRVISPGGIEAWLIESHNVPLISMSVSMHGGAAEDPAGKRGVSRVVESMFFEKTQRRSSMEYMRDWVKFGGSSNFSVSDEWISLTFQTLTDRRDETFDLLREAFAEPGYDQSALVCNIQHTLTHHDTSTEFHTEHGPFTLVPLSGNRSSLVWVSRPEEA